MSNTGKILAGPSSWGGPPDREADTAEDARLAQLAHAELAEMGMPRANVLLAGRIGATRKFLDGLHGSLLGPVVSWSPGERLALPSTENDATVILYDVGSLSLEEQIQLLEWLGLATGRIQVLSTTPVPLFPRVRAGAFIDTLFYRLNTVTLELSA